MLIFKSAHVTITNRTSPRVKKKVLVLPLGSESLEGSMVYATQPSPFSTFGVLVADLARFDRASLEGINRPRRTHVLNMHPMYEHLDGNGLQTACQ